VEYIGDHAGLGILSDIFKAEMCGVFVVHCTSTQVTKRRSIT
jgi:hypothetical protein